MEIENKRISRENFDEIRKSVITSWPTGKDVILQEGINYQKKISTEKNFSYKLKKADDEGAVLIQPRAGVALVDEHIELLKFLEEGSDLLSTTIDAYTRQNRYKEAQDGIDKSIKAGHSLLNGFPAVNHGLSECKRVVESLNKPLQIRHGTPDAKLLSEISLAAGFTAFEGGGISYNIPYTKRVPLEVSIRDWQYVDRLVGIYNEAGVVINREPFGPLSGTLVPPFVSHVVAILEGLLALEQGVKSITLGYGQAGNLVQDVAAINTLRKLAHYYFKKSGFENYELTIVLHQWMGGFPENEAKAYGVIGWGAVVAALSKVTKVITKTPHEAMGVPTKIANLQGIFATKQIVNMLCDQPIINSNDLSQEEDIIEKEVEIIMDKVFELGEGDIARGTVRAFEAGVIDVPFAPSIYNRGKLLPCRDNSGAVRILEMGNIPFGPSIIEFHKMKLLERSKTEGRQPGFQMVIDDIYAISKGKLVGRPE